MTQTTAEAGLLDGSQQSKSFRVTVLQSVLAPALDQAARLAGHKTHIPALNSLLLRTVDGRLEITATDLSESVVCSVGVKVEGEGQVLVPAHLLADLVGDLPDDRIDLSVSENGKRLSVKCARVSATIALGDADDMPPIPRTTDDAVTFSVAPGVLRAALARVVIAVAKDESRPVLAGMFWELGDGGTLTTASADGFRMAVQRLQVEDGEQRTGAWIVPRAAIADLLPLLASEPEDASVTVTLNKNIAVFRLKNTVLTAQLIQGTFPNYAQLIPKSHASRATFAAKNALSAVKRAGGFARGGSGIVRVQVEPGKDGLPGTVTVTGRTEETGESVDEFDCAVEGDAAKIAFNGGYLAEALGSFGDGKVTLETTSPSSPGVLRPVGSDEYMTIVMPMFVAANTW